MRELRLRQYRKCANKLRIFRVTNRLCVRCGTSLSTTKSRMCDPCRERFNASPSRQPRERQKNWLRHAQKVRDIVFAHYGNSRCACCGETNPLFLTLDHINGDGDKHRREMGARGRTAGTWFYRRMMREGYPPGIQVLCFNCNCGRARNGGVCPHHQNTETRNLTGDLYEIREYRKTELVGQTGSTAGEAAGS